ncbi:ubiquitin-conjugating enzyme [Nitzschia inconspicua]|uniref:Ubiquitin-conjugating enzyme n=1 Tax=Nitzschia inconspicua TaxID=303405 RepID=A0A9K3PTN9_9STRA|nr:ubiquitin-conjugating enzyme [Nitzschia inconspicua]
MVSSSRPKRVFPIPWTIFFVLWITRMNGVVSKRNGSSSSSRSGNNRSGNNKYPVGSGTPIMSSQASSSLHRIRKEYKDSVAMGIAYDWVNQKRILPSKKKRSKNKSTSSTTTTTTSTTEAEAPSSVVEDHSISQMFCLGPLTSNLRHWHFSFRGAGHIFGKGIYHGRIVLPKDYPLSPPKVQLWTPSGRFQPGVDICLSASSYHPESWTAKWTIFGLVNALRLHMLQPPMEIGGMTSSLDQMEAFARSSRTFRAHWYAGDTKIVVSHAKLLQEGILSIDEEEEDEENQEDVVVAAAAATNDIRDADNVSSESIPMDPIDQDDVDNDDKENLSSNKFHENHNKEQKGMDTTFDTKRKHNKKSKGQPPETNVKKYNVQESHRRSLARRQHVLLLSISELLTSPKLLLLSLFVLVILYRNK